MRWLLGAVGVFALAVVIVVVFFQWSWLRGPLQSRLSALTGKQVHIDGEIVGTKSWTPHITLNQVRIDEPGFGRAPKVATIDSIAFEIDLGSLLTGSLNFPLIEVAHPILDLLRNPDGKANWDIAAEASGPSERADTPVIGKLDGFRDGKATYRDVAAKRHDYGYSEDNRGQRRQRRRQLHAGRQGHLSRSALYHPPQRRLPERPAENPQTLRYRCRRIGRQDQDFCRRHGHQPVQNDRARRTWKLIADGDNAEDLYPIFGIPAPPTPPYHLTGTLDRDGKAWLFKSFAGHGRQKRTWSGSLRFETEGKKRILVSGNLESKNLNFADVGLLVGAPGSTEAGRPVSDTERALAEKMERTGRVLPDAPLNLDEVRKRRRHDLTFKGTRIDAQNLPLDNVDMHMKLGQCPLSLTPLKVGIKPAV